MHDLSTGTKYRQKTTWTNDHLVAPHLAAGADLEPAKTILRRGGLAVEQTRLGSRNMKEAQIEAGITNKLDTQPDVPRPSTTHLVGLQIHVRVSLQCYMYG